MEVFAWIGSILLAVCSVPQAYQSYREGHSRGISMAMIYMWASGEVFTLIYTVYIQEWALAINYGMNLLVLCVIIYYRIFPRREFESM